MRNKYFCTLIGCMYCIILPFLSCTKLVEVPSPLNQVINEDMFSNDKTATSAITGIYSTVIQNGNHFSSGSTTIYTGLGADELLSYATGTVRDEFFNNEIEVDGQGIINGIWLSAYNPIYITNNCIEQLSRATNLSAEVKDMLLGEAKFLRAFCYFYLVNLFGDVPLVVGTNYNENAILPRANVDDVYEFIIRDLEDARNLLNVSYPSAERVRVNKWAAQALLARIYLYKGNWDKAETAASEVINSGLYSITPVLNNVFLKGSNETIWQLMPPSGYAFEARSFIPPSAATSPTLIANPSLLSSFETADQRRVSWIWPRVYRGVTYYHPYKYKTIQATGTEYYVVLRLAEQYLIRAEARAQQNNISGAANDLNIIRGRAGLGTTPANDKNSMLFAIEKERRIELLAEFGHRWFDLKRTGRSDVVLSILKPLTWQPTDVLWPIPQTQINANPALTQNPGY